jgi:hypothetical protein
MMLSDDTGAARHEGAKPDDRPVAERVLTVHEIAEKLDIPAEAASALINAALRAS